MDPLFAALLEAGPSPGEGPRCALRQRVLERAWKGEEQAPAWVWALVDDLVPLLARLADSTVEAEARALYRRTTIGGPAPRPAEAALKVRLAAIARVVTAVGSAPHHDARVQTASAWLRLSTAWVAAADRPERGEAWLPMLEARLVGRWDGEPPRLHPDPEAERDLHGEASRMRRGLARLVEAGWLPADDLTWWQAWTERAWGAG